MELIVCVCILSAAIVFAAYTQQPKREAVTVPPVDKVLEVAQGVIMQQAELIDRFGDRLMGFTAEGRETQAALDGIASSALKYARSRHTTSDFGRSARQQQLLAVLDAIKTQLSEQVLPPQLWPWLREAVAAKQGLLLPQINTI